MKEILKLLLQIIKEKKEDDKYQATLVKMPINYAALEAMLRKVGITNQVIEIHQTAPDGSTTTLILKNDNKPEGFKSFKDRFNEAYNIK